MKFIGRRINPCLVTGKSKTAAGFAFSLCLEPFFNVLGRSSFAFRGFFDGGNSEFRCREIPDFRGTHPDFPVQSAPSTLGTDVRPPRRSRSAFASEILITRFTTVHKCSRMLAHTHKTSSLACECHMCCAIYCEHLTTTNARNHRSSPII
jgi:hypothetical protein